MEKQKFKEITKINIMLSDSTILEALINYNFKTPYPSVITRLIHVDRLNSITK